MAAERLHGDDTTVPVLAKSLLGWTAPDGINCARMRSLQISNEGAVRGDIALDHPATLLVTGGANRRLGGARP
jgi:hypothetical protein